VSRDGHAIMLQRRDSVARGSVWIGISELVALFMRVRSTNHVTVIRRPTNRRCALQMKLADPEGNILWFGTDPLTQVPFDPEPADDEMCGH
jgi:hypothetical protein